MECRTPLHKERNISWLTRVTGFLLFVSYLWIYSTVKGGDINHQQCSHKRLCNAGHRSSARSHWTLSLRVWSFHEHRYNIVCFRANYTPSLGVNRDAWMGQGERTFLWPPSPDQASSWWSTFFACFPLQQPSTVAWAETQKIVSTIFAFVTKLSFQAVLEMINLKVKASLRLWWTSRAKLCFVFPTEGL